MGGAGFPSLVVLRVELICFVSSFAELSLLIVVYNTSVQEILSISHTALSDDTDQLTKNTVAGAAVVWLLLLGVVQTDNSELWLDIITV